MRNLQRHWKSVAVVSVGVLGAGAWLWRGAEARMLLDPGGEPEPVVYEPLTQVQRDAIVNLLADVSLDRDALVGLNLSTSQAESVVAAVRTWYLSNHATLTSLDQAEQQKTVAVWELEKAVSMGPADAQRDSQLALARQDLQTARASYRSGFLSLETTVNNLLSETQRSTWAAVKVGHGRNMPIRLLDLTDAQRLAISDALQRYERQQAAAGDETARSTARTTLETAKESILTVDQRSVLQAYSGYFASSSQAVAHALDTVLVVAG